MIGSKFGLKVVISKKVQKNLKRIPKDVLLRFTALAEDLRMNGPIASNWKNYSKLAGNKYHCHLTYAYVACWSYTKGTINIEVYYVGSRENAPY